MRCFDARVNFWCVLNLHSKRVGWIQNRSNFWVHQSITPPKRCFNFWTIFSHRKDNKDLVQCPTPGCDGMGHSSGNYSTHRRYVFGMIYKKNNAKKYIYFIVSLGVQDPLSQKADQKMDLKLKLYGMIFFR